SPGPQFRRLRVRLRRDDRADVAGPRLGADRPLEDRSRRMTRAQTSPNPRAPSLQRAIPTARAMVIPAPAARANPPGSGTAKSPSFDTAERLTVKDPVLFEGNHSLIPK